MSESEDLAQRHIGCASAAACFAVALVGSVVVSAALTGGASRYPISPDLLPVTFIVSGMIAFLHLGMLGLPLYFLLSRRWKLRWWSAMLGGALVGAGPFTLFSFGSILSDTRGDLLRMIAWCGGYGAVGGLVFFLMLRRGAR